MKYADGLCVYCFTKKNDFAIPEYIKATYTVKSRGAYDGTMLIPIKSCLIILLNYWNYMII